MIKEFLIERRSWILLFIIQQLLIIFIALLDVSIPVQPILYISFLSIIIFVIFIGIRFNKETSFYKKISERVQNLDLDSVPESTSPFEKVIENSITEHLAQLKTTLSDYSITIEQEKDDLLAWVHEVKTPLTAMSLMIERIEDEKLKAHLTFEWLRIYLLLDQQLHQKRLFTLENDVCIERLDLQPIVFSELKTVQSWCIQKGIGFDLNLEAPHVLTDGKWLAFIIRQLITNAIKYSDADITITSYMENEQVVLEVKDLGRGIDKKDLPRIYDKGFTSTLDHLEQSASGMGLYLTKKAVDFLHINLTITSNLGEGTTCKLTFPKNNDFVHITSM
ncbi:ATP-binding protein [Bacillus sp. AK128]